MIEKSHQKLHTNIYFLPFWYVRIIYGSGFYLQNKKTIFFY